MPIQATGLVSQRTINDFALLSLTASTCQKELLENVKWTQIDKPHMIQTQINKQTD